MVTINGIEYEGLDSYIFNFKYTLTKLNLRYGELKLIDGLPMGTHTANIQGMEYTFLEMDSASKSNIRCANFMDTCHVLGLSSVFTNLIVEREDRIIGFFTIDAKTDQPIERCELRGY